MPCHYLLPGAPYGYKRGEGAATAIALLCGLLTQGCKNVSEDEQLLDEARPFCDSASGEVIERMPEELMKKLRAGKLARGIRGKPSRRTESHATWFVFLNSEIQDRVLLEWRKANATRKRSRGSRTSVSGSSSSDARPKAGRGLKEFRQRKNRM